MNEKERTFVCNAEFRGVMSRTTLLEAFQVTESPNGVYTVESGEKKYLYSAPIVEALEKMDERELLGKRGIVRRSD